MTYRPSSFWSAYTFMTMIDIADNIRSLEAKIVQTSKKYGRPRGDVKLVAVTKGHPEEAVRCALKEGLRVFGENRVQEAKLKFSQLKIEFPDIDLHLIGPLQSNKVMEAVRLFDVIETVDRPKLADELSKAIRILGRTPRLYIEINIAEEPQKAGISPCELPSFFEYCAHTSKLNIEGLMCIPPQKEDPTPYFIKLHKLASSLHLSKVSMGMSGDYREAIAAGSTEIRVGTALFGTRSPATAVKELKSPGKS